MKQKFGIFAVILCSNFAILSFGQNRLEQDAGIGREASEAVVETITHPWLFVSADVGQSQVDSHARGEIDMRGRYGAIRGDIDFYFDWLTLEGGGGYLQTSLSARDSATQLKQKAGVSTAILDGSARLRIGEAKSFEFGLINQILFGTESDFGPISGANDKNYFYGLTASYQPSSLRNLRFSAQYLKDYTIKTRDVSFAMLSLQYGIPIRQAKKSNLVVPVKVRHTFEFGAIIFEPGSALLTAEAYPILQEVAAAIKNHPEITVLTIAGHTDSAGDDKVNLRLSALRARVVADFLVSKGIATQRLNPRGYGERRPLVPNDTPANRAKNRRVEFIVEAVK